MIEKEKVIKGLECCMPEQICKGCPYKETDECEDRGYYYSKAIEDAIALLKEQETEWNKWVKCSDGMPEEQESIFAKFKGTNKWVPAMFSQSSEDVRVVIVFADGTRKVSHSRTIDGKWECEKGPLKKTVTHWMPNPKLPKEGL